MHVQLNAFTLSLTLHVAAVLWLIGATVGGTRALAVGTAAPPPRTIKIEWPATLPPPPDAASPAPARPSDPDLTLDADATELQVGGVALDLEPIASRARELFPFLTNPLVLEPALAAVRKARGSGLVSPLPAARDASGRPPLDLSALELQAIVDRAWTRRERWQAFRPIAELLDAHSPYAGQLARLIERYSHDNVLQPYADPNIRDPRLWTMLRLAAEHVDFVGLITGYAAQFPSSETTTELLLLLDDIVQGSRDTLLVLLDLDPQRDLWVTRSLNPDAQRFAAALQQHYRSGLPRTSGELRQAIRVHYDNVRVAILESLLASTPAGYKADDVRFLLGSIHWTQKRPEEAVRWWRQMTVGSAGRHALAIDELQAVLASEPDAGQAQRIANVLARHRGRWAAFWSGRLRQFGHRSSTY